MPIPRRSPRLVRLRADARHRFLAIARAIPVVVAVSLLSACDAITGPSDLRSEQRDLDRAWRIWSSTYIDDYEYVVRHDCYCQLGGVNVRVTVHNRYVVSREIDGTSTSVPGSSAYNYPTIDGLFSIIQDAIDTRARRVDGRYDNAYGFPTDVWIDYSYGGSNDTERYTLLAFRSLR